MIAAAGEFVRTAVGGVVHVLDHYLAWDQPAKVDGVIEVVTTVRPVALCGRRGVRDDIVVEFDHRDLCRACWAATPPELRSRIVAA